MSDKWREAILTTTQTYGEADRSSHRRDKNLIQQLFRAKQLIARQGKQNYTILHNATPHYSARSEFSDEL